MSLTARLRRTIPEPHGDDDGARAPADGGLDGPLAQYDTLRARMARWARPPEEAPPSLEEALGGEAREVPGAGSAWVIDTRYPLSHAHGADPLEGFYATRAGHLDAVMADPRLEAFDPRDTVFLDIEATGLDHGAGTIAFLIGVGYLDGDAFLVRQLLVRDPADEAAALSVLVDDLDRFSYLVSFNGKSYDLTVLQSRLVMHRLYSRERSALKLRPHLDLLHLSRNLYRGVWEDTKLGTLERRALDFHRVDDIPGHLVPSCWFAWLQHRNPAPLAAVARHNLHDVLSMVTLGGRVIRDSALADHPGRVPEVTVNLAHLLARRGLVQDALTLLDRTARDRLVPDAQRGALRLEATCARRLRDHDRRAHALRALLEMAPGDRDALIALAIVEERARHLPEALALARRARALAEDEAITRRIERLERRIGAAD